MLCCDSFDRFFSGETGIELTPASPHPDFKPCQAFCLSKQRFQAQRRAFVFVALVVNQSGEDSKRPVIVPFFTLPLVSVKVENAHKKIHFFLAGVENACVIIGGFYA